MWPWQTCPYLYYRTWVSEGGSSASGEEWECHGGQIRPCDKGNIWSRPWRMSSVLFPPCWAAPHLGQLTLWNLPGTGIGIRLHSNVKETAAVLVTWLEDQLYISVPGKSDNPPRGTLPHRDFAPPCRSPTRTLWLRAWFTLSHSPISASDSLPLASKFQAATAPRW